MAAKFLLVVAMAAAALVGTAMGADHTVGAPNGSWDLQTNYVQWTSGRTFRAGDRLVFQYNAAQHDVVEVSKANYDACSASNPISTVQTGNDVVPLTAAGSRYFICSIGRHCAGGMKVQVNVEAAPAAGGAPSPVNTPAGGAPSPVNTPAGLPAPAPSTKVPATPSSSAASVGVGSLGGAVVVAALTMMLFN